MTNNQIIFNERMNLLEAGILHSTGRKMRCCYTDDNGEVSEMVVDEPEDLHTFKEWKDRGYMVQKGQKAIARFTIWNYTSMASKAARGAAEAEGKDPADDPHFYMKEACFFAAHQVKRIDAEPQTGEKLLPILWPGLMLPAVA